MAKAKPLTFASKAKQLRTFGYPVQYGKRGKTRAVDKAAVTRAWNKVSKFIENEKQKFVWQPAQKKDLRGLKEGFGKQSVTPKGFFLKVPKGVKKAPKVKVRVDGAITYEATGPGGGKVKEIIHRVDPLLVADDLDAEVEKLRRTDPPPDDVGLTVNGFDSPMTEDYDLETLTAYLAYDLFPRLKDPNIDPVHKKKHGKKKLTDEQIADIFHLKFSYYKRGNSRHARKTKSKNRSRRR